MSDTIVWVHADALSPQNPALLRFDGAPAVFVWDDEWLAQAQISMKRIMFIYEALLELPIVIRRGSVAAEVVHFAAEHGATSVATIHSPNPRFHHHARKINAQVERLQVYKVPPFIDTTESLDLKRFSRYWRTAQNYAYEYTVQS